MGLRPRRPDILHSQALLVNLRYAEDNELVDRHPIGDNLWDAVFGGDVAKQAGFLRVNIFDFEVGDSATLLSTIAYSALEKNNDGSGLVFGNTGIRAMFDDANELCAVVAANAVTEPLAIPLTHVNLHPLMARGVVGMLFCLEDIAA